MKWFIPAFVALFVSPVFANDCADTVAGTDADLGTGTEVVAFANTATPADSILSPVEMNEVNRALKTADEIYAIVVEAEKTGYTLWFPITRRQEMLKQLFADYGRFVLSDTDGESLAGLVNYAYKVNPVETKALQLDYTLREVRSTWGLYETDPAAGILREDLGVFLKNIRRALGK